MTKDRTGEGAMTLAKTEYQIEPSTQEIVITRVFDAPRDLVFKAFTDPKLLPKWWGPRGYSTTIDEMDVRPGGSFRFIQHDASGNEYAFKGVYHLIDPPKMLISTFEFEGVAGHVALQTVKFEESDGRTTLIQHSVFQSVADRDGMVESGMEKGATESMDRLAELLTELSKDRRAR